jgi:peptide/nickel transport system ATP-binding protein
MNAPLLTLQDVHVRFPIGMDWLGRSTEWVHALNGVDLDILPGETLGVVGESGCGKTTLAQVVIGLVKPTAGALRGRPDSATARMQIVFQDPQSSLDPRLPVWRIISEPLHVERRGKLSRAALRQAAMAVAAQVEIPPDYLDRYPHEFSGGQRQRIAIARALVTEPDLILLDEPTSALDISVQAQILNLLNDLQRRLGLTYLLISHNVAVVRHMSDRVAVMYLGQIVELGRTEEVLRAPLHPYTRLLLESVPRLGEPVDEDALSATTELPGNRRLPGGCFFRDRCPLAQAGCERPQALAGQARLRVRCHVQAQEVPC